jgi:DNA modification methylase
MEIGNYCEFLDVMGRNEMLAMFFVHDAGETQQWRLKGHCKKIFWEWVSTWAIMFQNPRDIGFEMEGYDLPPLNLIERKIITEKRNNGQLFNDVAVSATTFNAELRITIIERLNDVAGIVNGSNENFLIWIKQNAEGEELKKLIPKAVEVTGSDSTEYKEEKLLGFADNKFSVLVSKTKICGQGMNYQNCHNQVFASLDFSFESLFQGIRRSWRFGQTHAVNIYIVTTDTMENVIQSIKRKEEQFEEMQKEMTLACTRTLNIATKPTTKRKFQQYKTDKFMYQLGDSVQLIRNLESESVGFSIWSPPFPTLYVYSNENEDMGNCKDFDQFFKGFNFLIPELFRVMETGRNVAVHCMDVPIQKGKEGYIGLRDFSGMIIQSFIDAGFVYHSRVTLWKNPVTEMQRTKALGLLHKQVKKDAAMCRVGIPDYLLVFRKDGVSKNPVVHQDKDASKPNYIPVDLWQKYASPVWMDIDFGDTLNGRNAKEEDDERHIAPLAIPIINRALHLWSNEGDTVLTTYGGIGSEGVESIKLKRKAILFELKKSYYDEGVKNCIAAEIESNQHQLFI